MTAGRACGRFLSRIRSGPGQPGVNRENCPGPDEPSIVLSFGSLGVWWRTMNNTQGWRKSSWSQGASNCAEVSAWRKSSASASGACAEIGAYRTSSASINDAGAGSECAEVGTGPAVVGIRDTKQAHLGAGRTVLEFSPGAWGRFLAGVRAGTV